MSKTDQNSIIGLFEAHSLLLRVNLRSAVTSDCPDQTVVDVANWWWTISNFWCMGRPWPGPAVLCWLLAAKSLSINLYLRRMALAASIPHQAAADQHTVENIHVHAQCQCSDLCCCAGAPWRVQLSHSESNMWSWVWSVERWPVRAAGSQDGCLSVVWSVAGGEWW